MSGSNLSNAEFQAAMNKKVQNAHLRMKTYKTFQHRAPPMSAKAKQLLGIDPKNNSYKVQQLLGKGGKHRRTRRRRCMHIKKSKSNRRK